MRNKILIRSRHPSHFPIREKLQKLPFRGIVRFGSISTIEEINQERRRKGYRPITNHVECNSTQSVKNSSSKLLMKRCFTQAGVKTADWWTLDRGLEFMSKVTNTNTHIGSLPFPVVSKSHYGSRGMGNTLLNSREELEAWMVGKTLNNYIFEKYYSYSREYRLHITSKGCFYTNRKMLKRDAPEGNKWQRHDDNCVWILENNPAFDKPNNWNEIVEHSIKALNAVGLDIGAVDVRVQSSTKQNGKPREIIDFIIVEINSAPSFGEVTEEKYLIEIPKVLIKKHENR